MDTLGTALQAADAGARVAGIAVVRWVGPRKDVRTWTGAVVAKRECEVVDATLRPTTLTPPTARHRCPTPDFPLSWPQHVLR